MTAPAERRRRLRRVGSAELAAQAVGTPDRETPPTDVLGAGNGGLELWQQAQLIADLYRRQDDLIRADITALFDRHGGADGFRGLLKDTVAAIVGQHADAASLIAAKWVNDTVPGAAVSPLVDIPRAQTDKTVDWALFAPGAEPPVERLTTAAQRLTRNAARQTITGNAKNVSGGYSWARYASPTACAFCRMLATRSVGKKAEWVGGGVYTSEAAAMSDSSFVGEIPADQLWVDDQGHEHAKYHRHCHCQPVPIPPGGSYVVPPFVKDWDEQYAEATANLDERGEPTNGLNVASEMRRLDAEKKKKRAADDQAAADRAAARKAAQKATAEAARRAPLVADLNNAKTVEEVTRAAQALHPGMLFRFSDGLDVEQLKATMFALNNMTEKYGVKVRQVLSVPDRDTVIARTVSDSASLRAGIPPSITINRKFWEDPSWFDLASRNAVARGFHYSGTGVPGYDHMIHELGHVMVDMSEMNGQRLDFYPEIALWNYWEAHYGAQYVEAARTDPLIYDKKFEEWLAANKSKYAKTNNHELLAEAFQDVETNGDNAHEMSKVLHRMIVEAAAGNPYQVGAAAQWTVSGAAVDPPRMDELIGAGA